MNSIHLAHSSLYFICFKRKKKKRNKKGNEKEEGNNFALI